MRRGVNKLGVELPTVGLFFVLALLFGWRVGTPVLHLWDEARLAVNATEMLGTGDWLVTRYHGQPDLWNTKPPLLIWLQAASLYLLGYNTWALRLPSVLAALATAGMLYRFGREALGSRFVGMGAALVLATSPGFNGTHVARFGDYDALLCLGLTGTALNWYQYARQRQGRQLGRGAGWFALALLTKSAAALLVLPAVGLYLALRPDTRWVFGQWRTYGAIAGALLPLALFYGLREAAAPGYLAATWFNDWYGRLSQHIVTVSYPWWMYWQRLAFPGLLVWSPFLLAGIGVGTRRDGTVGAAPDFARFAALFIFGFLVLISGARTRLLWYSAPVYPMAALLCALGVAQLARHARNHWHWPKPLVVGTLTLAFLVSGGVLLSHEWHRWDTEQSDFMLHYGYQLPRLAASRPPLQPFTILCDRRNNAVLDFYVAALRKQGLRPQLVVVADSALPALRPFQQVLMCAGPLQHLVHQRYATRPLTTEAPCEFVEILGPR